METIETKLREELVPILGLDSVDEIQPDSALVRDLGAESIDYIEILYMIENVFGVKIKIAEITMNDYGAGGLPSDGKLTEELAARLNRDFDGTQFEAGQSISDIFRIFTVHNLAAIIARKQNAK